ncbi:acyl carrier protein [Lentzea aerocolonigenes]|uniref:acyl carrier protein n=1 Tax=Lentzea aerocolonigenes TaxID=68170 RepID=UPI0006895DF2|nr:acyl carrier protein [Lentzea aerocolonigenes]MCP2243437.1 Acyl carrier protein [Lentzea aerocolonigenes]
MTVASVEAVVVGILSEVLEEPAEALRDQPRLAAHERWDSMRTLEVLGRLEEELSIRLDLRRFHQVRTVGDLVELVGEC